MFLMKFEFYSSNMDNFLKISFFILKVNTKNEKSVKILDFVSLEKISIFFWEEIQIFSQIFSKKSNLSQTYFSFYIGV